MTRGTPYEQVESWLESYKMWKSKIEALKIQLDDIPGLGQHFDLVAIHGEGQNTDPVFKTVVKRTEIMNELPKLERRIQLIEVSFSALTPEEREFVEIRYIDQLASSLTMDRLNLSKKMYYVRRSKLLDKIYETMGGSTCLSTFLEDENKFESERIRSL